MAHAGVFGSAEQIRANSRDENIANTQTIATQLENSKMVWKMEEQTI